MHDDRPSLDALLSTARQTRESMGHTSGWAPTILYASKDGEQGIAMLGSDEPVPAQLATALIEIHRVMGAASWIAFTGDTYAKHVSLEEASDMLMQEANPEQGKRLAEQFKEGVPEVIEVMVVMLASHRGDIQSGYQSYRYTPSDGWEWDDPEFHSTDEHGGAVYRVLETFFEAQNVAEELMRGEK